MLITLIPFLLILNVVTIKEDQIILFSRLFQFTLAANALISFNNLYILPISKGIGFYAGLYHLNIFYNKFIIILYLTLSILLIMWLFIVIMHFIYLHVVIVTTTKKNQFTLENYTKKLANMYKDSNVNEIFLLVIFVVILLLILLIIGGDNLILLCDSDKEEEGEEEKPQVKRDKGKKPMRDISSPNTDLPVNTNETEDLDKKKSGRS
jgi:hypothetical protein